MQTTFQRIAIASALALAAGPFLVGSAMAEGNAFTKEPSAASTHAKTKKMAMSADESALAATVIDAIKSGMGDDAKNVTATARNHNVTLVGWVNDNAQDSQARKIASKVPGVKKVFSKMHVWSSDNS